MRQIEIIVGPDGKTTVQTKGFAGASCRDASRLVEQALGVVENEKLTAEFYLTGEVRQENQAKN
jgi:hypothetical protein